LAGTGSLPVDFTVYGNIFLRPVASTAVPSGRRRRQLLQNTAEAPAPGLHLDNSWLSRHDKSWQLFLTMSTSLLLSPYIIITINVDVVFILSKSSALALSLLLLSSS